MRFLFALVFFVGISHGTTNFCIDLNDNLHKVGQQQRINFDIITCVSIVGSKEAEWRYAGCVDENGYKRTIGENWCDYGKRYCWRCESQDCRIAKGCVGPRGDLKQNGEVWNEANRVFRCEIIDGIVVPRTIACVPDFGSRKQSGQCWIGTYGTWDCCINTNQFSTSVVPKGHKSCVDPSGVRHPEGWRMDGEGFGWTCNAGLWVKERMIVWGNPEKRRDYVSSHDQEVGCRDHRGRLRWDNEEWCDPKRELCFRCSLSYSNEDSVEITGCFARGKKWTNGEEWIQPPYVYRCSTSYNSGAPIAVACASKDRKRKHIGELWKDVDNKFYYCHKLKGEVVIYAYT